MASRKTLREQQLAASVAARTAAEALGSQSDPRQAREKRDAILAHADAAVEIIETLARVEA